MHSQKNKALFALLVNLLIPLAGISTDIYLPSLPALGQYFGASVPLVQMTVTVYVVAMGVGQLLAGPVSDALGRRRLLMMALCLQLFSVLGIIFSTHMATLLVLRFTQGLGSALMIVPARAIINDVFDGPSLRKMFNYLTISFALGPIVAPFLGGYLQTYFGWQANFYFLAGYILINLTFVLTWYRETIAEKRPFAFNHIVHNYQHILSDRPFVVGTLFVGLIFGYTSLFNVAGPFIIQTTFAQSPIVFGRSALLIGIAWLSGNVLNRILFHVDKHVKIQIAIILTLFATTTMIALTASGYASLLTYLLPTFVMVLASGFIFPIFVGACLARFPAMAASTNGCFFAMTWFAYSLFTLIAAQLKSHSLIPMSLSNWILSLVVMLFYYCFVRRHDMN